MHPTFSFGDVEILDACQELESPGTIDAYFCCVDYFGRFDPRFGKKLLRFPTGLSSGAMVAPVDGCHDFAPEVA